MAKQWIGVYRGGGGHLIIDCSREWATRLADRIGEGTTAEWGGVRGHPDYNAHARRGAERLGAFCYWHPDQGSQGEGWLLDGDQFLYSNRRAWGDGPTRDQFLALLS